MTENAQELAKYYTDLQRYEATPVYEIERSVAMLKLIKYLGQTRAQVRVARYTRGSGCWQLRLSGIIDVL